MDKKTAHYSLDEIKTAFADPEKLNRSFVSKRDAAALGMTDEDVVAVVQSLERSDLDKSMTSHADHTIWQDVYKPTVGGREMYVKFTVDSQGEFFLISFKEA